MSLLVETEVKKARVVQVGDRIELQVWSRFEWTVDSAFQIYRLGFHTPKNVVNTQVITRLMLLIDEGYSIAEFRIG